MAVENGELLAYARNTASTANRAIERAKTAQRIGHSPRTARELNIALVAANEARIAMSKEMTERFNLTGNFD